MGPLKAWHSRLSLFKYTICVQLSSFIACLFIAGAFSFAPPKNDAVLPSLPNATARVASSPGPSSGDKAAQEMLV